MLAIKLLKQRLYGYVSHLGCPTQSLPAEANQLEQVLYSCITAYLFANVRQIVPHRNINSIGGNKATYKCKVYHTVGNLFRNGLNQVVVC